MAEEQMSYDQQVQFVDSVSNFGASKRSVNISAEGG